MSNLGIIVSALEGSQSLNIVFSVTLYNSNYKFLHILSILGYEGKIKPEKGAAAFWYDLLSDGFRDIKSLHGGCPVLKGSKWILNKWLYMLDNFKKFPCKLAKHSRFSPPSKSHYFQPKNKCSLELPPAQYYLIEKLKNIPYELINLLTMEHKT